MSDRSKRVLASVLASMCAFTCSLAVKNVPSGPSGVESSSKNTSKRIRGKKKNRAGSEIKRSGKVSGVSGKKKTKGSNKSSQKQSRTLNKDKTTGGAKSFLKLEDKKESEGLSTVGKAAAIGVPTLFGTAAFGTLVGRKLYYENLIKKSKVLDMLIVNSIANAQNMGMTDNKRIVFSFNNRNYGFVVCFSGQKVYIVYAKGESTNFKSRLQGYKVSQHFLSDVKSRSKILHFVADKILPGLGFTIPDSKGAESLAKSKAFFRLDSATPANWYVYNFDSGADLLEMLGLAVGAEGTLTGEPELKVVRIE